uniref:Small nuclear RNA activating complex, polypeptide 4 n=1 Tax=Oncorhynchus kisutch TaxID=8019 RepID=A0A8C7D3C6_ONCKI
GNLEAERERIQREIEELESTLGPGAFNAEILSGSQGPCLVLFQQVIHCFRDLSFPLDLPQNTDTCLQINLVYQEVLKEKLEYLEQLLTDNQQQQATTSGEPTLKLFLGSFLKPYFRDKVTFLVGMSSDSSNHFYITVAGSAFPCSALKENELMGGRYDDHDWQKISNIDFEGIREAEDIKSFWQNYLHPSINKASWKEDEIEMLKKVAVKYGHHNWDQIADKLGTNRTAFMCLQTYQRYICTDFKRRMWCGVEDDILRELVEKMRIGNYIPYTQISYFMEGRDSCQLMYRWTQVLDPTLRKGHWSKEEDEMLLRAVAKHGAGNWWKMRQDKLYQKNRVTFLDNQIAAEMPNRIDSQVLQQWRRMTGYKVSVDYVALLSFSTQSVTLNKQLITLLFFQQQNSQLVMMIPQTFVIGQPVVQSTPHPMVPFTPTSRQQLMPSTLTQPGPSTPSRPIPSTPGQPLPSTPSQPILPAPVQSSIIIDRVNVQVNENLSAKKRNLKPTEKSQAPKEVKDAAIAKKSVEQSPKRKKARTQSPPKGNLVGQLSNIILSPPQTAWVLTREGLVPISGICIQMTPQNLPANAFAPACPSPDIINQQVPLTLNAAAAQASSNVTHVCPSSSASSIAQGTASPSVFSSPSASTTFISNTAPRMTNPVSSMRMTNPVLQTVATTCPQLNAVSPVLSVPKNTVISAPIRPQTGPPQAFVLNVPPGSLPASFPQGAFRIMQFYPPKRVPPPRNPEVIQFDPNLIFMEDPAKVSKWLNGKNGIALPELDVTLPYLPPFVSSLDTLSSLLKCKTTLAISAMMVLHPEEKENQEEEQQVAAVRSLVAERFIHNPGYLLLKARFLSCFTMPALLATINPVKFPMSPTPEHSDVEEEPFRNPPGMQIYTLYEQQTTLQVSSVSNQSSFLCLIHCLSVLFSH